MRIDSLYPVLLADDVQTSTAFWTEHFGFEPVFENEWYVQLINPSQPACQLGILLQSHESVPDFLRQTPQTVLLTLEVPDATKEFKRLTAAGVEILQPPREEAWGQRHFISAGPDGVLIDIVEMIAASGEYATQYKSEQFA